MQLLPSCSKNISSERTALRVHQFAQRESHLSTTMYDGTETDTLRVRQFAQRERQFDGRETTPVNCLTTHAGPRRGN
jgi:hypothetical protein